MVLQAQTSSRQFCVELGKEMEGLARDKKRQIILLILTSDVVQSIQIRRPQGKVIKGTRPLMDR